MSEQVLKQLQGVVTEAIEERRGLVVYSRLQPIEIDRMARRVERQTIEKIRGLLPESTDDQRVAGLQNRLRRMTEELEQLEGLVDIQGQSRQMQSDEIVWQAFEDIAWMLGIE
jgi:predicted TIM-barrel fold metal-dependent hydrolase